MGGSLNPDKSWSTQSAQPPLRQIYHQRGVENADNGHNSMETNQGLDGLGISETSSGACGSGGIDVELPVGISSDDARGPQHPVNAGSLLSKRDITTNITPQERLLESSRVCATRATPSEIQEHTGHAGQINTGDPAEHERTKSSSPTIAMQVDYLPAATSWISNHKVAAMHSTNLPNTHPVSGLKSSGRRRSRSIGSTSRESRIAALSLQLRTRLSYAAARVEKNRQSYGIQPQLPTSLLQNNHPSPTINAEALSRVGQSTLMGAIESQRLGSGSPDGTTVSAPDPPATSNHYTLGSPMRLSPVTIPNNDFSLSCSQRDPQKQSSKPTFSKLAPPLDIISSRFPSQRHRPSPNNPGHSSHYSRIALHRRHHSQQELNTFKSTSDSEVVLVPETPPLRPSAPNIPVPHNSIPDHSRNSAMEQDAIETLLFMSSPGNSGYHTNSQNSQHQQNAIQIDSGPSQSSTNMSVSWTANSPKSVGDGSGAINGSDSQAAGLEAQAGDEIDRMLDQMDSESDDEKKYISGHSAPLRSGQTRLSPKA